VLKVKFPTTSLFEDVCKVSGKDLINVGFIPSKGLIVGGFPCQDLSVAGKRAGLEGSRSGLFWEIIRLLKETKAQYAILENVPGLLSSNNGNDMATVIAALDDIGYCSAWRVLDAQHFGVPQRRRRVFIIASLGNNWQSLAEILSISEGRAGFTEKGKSKRKGSATTIARGLGASGVAGTLATRDYKGLAPDDLLDNKAILDYVVHKE
jgi:DNA (cytosine-5)-methyltransferase 1